jgi:GntR family transcriptional repressor for pyruvate dehydrogenase complex
VSQTDFLYEQLMNRILSGQYPTSTRLPPEETIAEEFDVSRAVVRNALLRMKSEGVVDSRRGSGTTVIRGQAAHHHTFGPLDSVADIHECFQFRLHFEPGVAYMAAERRTDADLQIMSEAVYRLRTIKSTNMVETVEADMAFHTAVVDAAHNRFVKGTYEAWRPQIAFTSTMSANLSQSWSDVRRQEMEKAHAAIFKCIEAKDAAGAAATISRHITAAQMTVFHGRITLEQAGIVAQD